MYNTACEQQRQQLYTRMAAVTATTLNMNYDDQGSGQKHAYNMRHKHTPREHNYPKIIMGVLGAEAPLFVLFGSFANVQGLKHGGKSYSLVQPLKFSMPALCRPARLQLPSKRANRSLAMPGMAGLVRTQPLYNHVLTEKRQTPWRPARRARKATTAAHTSSEPAVRLACLGVLAGGTQVKGVHAGVLRGVGGKAQGDPLHRHVEGCEPVRAAFAI